MGKALASLIQSSGSGASPSTISYFSSGNIAKDTTGFPSEMRLMVNQAQLLCLPEEILLKIAEAVYGTDENIFKDIGELCNRQPTIDWASVSSLSKTCRKLRRIVQPLLFRCAYSKGYLNDGAVNLIQSLMSRPELAGQVRDAVIGDWVGVYNFRSSTDGKKPKRWQVTPEEAAFFNHELAKFDVRISQFSYDSEDRLSKSPETSAGKVSPIHQMYDSFSAMAVPEPQWATEKWLATLAILQARNVERLVLRTCRWTLPDQVTLPAPLQNLVEISWINDYLNFGGLIDYSVAWVLAAAPALQTFRGVHIRTVKEIGFKHESVTEVVLIASCLKRESLDALFVAFPNLERFTYQSWHSPSSWDEATPQSLAQALLPLRKTLKYLRLEWDDAFIGEPAWALPLYCRLGAIANLAVLKELVLSCEGLDIASGGYAFLKQLIPPNLEILELYNRRGHRSMDKFFAAAADLFPKLTKIRCRGGVSKHIHAPA